MTHRCVFFNANTKITILRDYVPRSYDIWQGIEACGMELIPHYFQGGVEAHAFRRDGAVHGGHFYYHKGCPYSMDTIFVPKDWDFGDIVWIALWVT